MPAVVYMLRSRTGRHYYGSTNDLQRRLEQHARGHTYTTAKDAPWQLIASREFESLEQARQQERIFKKWSVEKLASAIVVVPILKPAQQAITSRNRIVNGQRHRGHHMKNTRHKGHPSFNKISKTPGRSCWNSISESVKVAARELEGKIKV